MKKGQGKLGWGEGDAEVTVFTLMMPLLHCCMVSAVKISTRHEWRDGRDVGAAASSCLGDAWLRNATWRNISCVEGSTGRRIKDLAKTVDEEDYQLQSSAGHCMYQSSADVEDGSADTWTRNVSRENLHCCSRV